MELLQTNDTMEEKTSMSRDALMTRDEDTELSEATVHPLPFIACVGSALCGLFIPACCYQLDTRTEALIFHLGVLTGIEKEPGCHCVAPFGVSTARISMKQATLDLPQQKVLDGKGNPIMVSAIINYRIVDSKKAYLNVDNAAVYLRVNAQATLKHVVSRYSYDELKSETDMVNNKMLEEVQQVVKIAGIFVEQMALNDLSYAPEVAAAMLKKQQAHALIEARTLIVEGAVQIAKDAVEQLEKGGGQGMQLTNEQKVHLVTNLLTVTCGDTDATPTIAM